MNRDLSTTIIVVKMVYATRMTPEWYFVEADEGGHKFNLIRPKIRVEADGSFIGDGVYFPHDDELWPLPILDRDQSLYHRRGMKYDYLGSPQRDPKKPWRWRPWIEVEFTSKVGQKAKTCGPG